MNLVLFKLLPPGRIVGDHEVIRVHQSVHKQIDEAQECCVATFRGRIGSKSV